MAVKVKSVTDLASIDPSDPVTVSKTPSQEEQVGEVITTRRQSLATHTKNKKVQFAQQLIKPLPIRAKRFANGSN